MNSVSCTICGRRKVVHKKRSLCNKCYAKHYHLGTLPPLSIEDATNNRKEKDFIKNYFRGRINFVFQPASFEVIGYGKYTPDFYDQETGFFIEVAGTRQAYDLNHEKYIAFSRTFPSVLFEVRTSNGQIVDFSLERQPNMTWNYNLN